MHWRRTRLILATFLITAAGVFVFLLVGAVDHVRHMAGATQCTSNLCELQEWMRQYEGTYGHFPPAYVVDADGKPAHSWRVLLLELFAPDLYRAYDFTEPWDGPNNQKLSARIPPVYRCPNAPASDPFTSFVVVVGKDTAFPAPGVAKRSDIIDKWDETILLVEAPGLRVHWMEPRDYDLDAIPLEVSDATSARLSSFDRSGPALVCVDMTVFRLAPSAPPDQLRAMATIAGGERIDTDRVRRRK